MNIKALRDQRAAYAAEARNLLDTNTGEKFSKEIEAQVDAIYEKIDRVDAQIARAERQAKIDGDAAQADADADAADRVRAGLSPDQRDHQDRYQAAFRAFLARGERGLTAEEMQTLAAANPQNAQTIGTGAGGGYLVPAGFGGALLEALKAFGGMRNVAQVIQTAGGNALPWPTVDETAAMGELVPENQAASDGDLTFGTVSIGAHKWSSKVFTLPFELLQDQGAGIDVEALVRRSAAARIARSQNQKYTTGSGTNEPQGILTGAAAGKIGATGTATSPAYEDMIDLEHSVDPAYRSMPGVGWMFHDFMLRNLKKMKDLSGYPLWLPGLSAKDPDTFLRYRYTINQDMPEPAANAKSILFGDLSQYLIRDVMEVTLFRFDDSNFTRRGQVGFLAWARSDGKLVSAGKPVKFFQHSAS